MELTKIALASMAHRTPFFHRTICRSANSCKPLLSRTITTLKQPSPVPSFNIRAHTVTDYSDLPTAFAECHKALRESLHLSSKEHPSFILAFLSDHYHEEFDNVGKLLHSTALNPSQSLAVAGTGCPHHTHSPDTSHLPAVSIIAATGRLEFETFHLPTPQDLDLIPHSANGDILLTVTDGEFFNEDSLLRSLDLLHPEPQKLAFLASAEAPAMWRNGQYFTSGCIGARIRDPLRKLRCDVIHAHSARPVGVNGIITKCQRNVLEEIDHKPAAVFLGQTYQTLQDHERELAKNMLLGIDVREQEPQILKSLPLPEVGPLDNAWVVRNIMGIKQPEGHMITGEQLKNGQTVCLHLPDPDTGVYDFKAKLAELLHKKRIRMESGQVSHRRTKFALFMPSLARQLLLQRSPILQEDEDFEVVSRFMKEEIEQEQQLVAGTQEDSDIVVSSDEGRKAIDSMIGGLYVNGEAETFGKRTILNGYSACLAVFGEEE